MKRYKVLKILKIKKSIVQRAREGRGQSLKSPLVRISFKVKKIYLNARYFLKDERYFCYRFTKFKENIPKGNIIDIGETRIKFCGIVIIYKFKCRNFRYVNSF
jgi:hypothetical protein